MNIAETLNEGLKRGFRVTIPAADLASRIDKAIAEVAPQVRMPGFRPGKVPGNLIRKMHGPALRGEAIKEAVNDGVNKLLADNGLRPAVQPKVDLDPDLAEGKDVTFTVDMEVLPVIEAPKIDGIKLERLTVEADDAAMADALRKLADSQKAFEDAPAKHKAKMGDQVVMDFAGSVDGVAFEGGTGEGMDVELGSGRLIPGFEEQLVGVKTGDEKVLNLTFPSDYGAGNLAGKAAEFKVKVTAVKVAKPVAVDDTLATNLGLENLEKLKEVLKDQVESELNGMTRTHLKRKLLDQLAASHDFAVPPSMVDAEFDQIWAQLEEEAKGDSEATSKLDAEREDYRRIAERRVRLGLLLSEIGQANGVQISQAEMSRLVAQEARRFPGQEQEVAKYFSENAMAAAQLRAPLYEEKVVDFLLGKAEISDRVVSREELQAAIESEDETPGHVHGPDCGHDHDHDHAPVKTKKPAKKAVAAEAVAEEAPVKKPAAKKAKDAEAAPAEAAAEAPAAPAKKARAKKADAA
ncbi:trigger factor [Sandaracinobacteroides saxicola]|uniref:Trigger factor n=1 Tax=Sandaracinobacteroides saxicola TaxID=2759707 RepID=A0A7G5IIC8_9SPHN|nr:trigger factor [Sandaracinobacteroides saxicola]QMW23120.1 trigger factor [Sandaracinobacteroides saxicola]